MVLKQVRIRLYNQEFRSKYPYPKGVFQGLYDIDSVIGSDGLPDLSFWLSKKEIEACKRDFHGAFNWGEVDDEELKRRFGYEKTLDAYGDKDLEQLRQILLQNEARYGAKVIPRNWLGRFTIGDIILGLSSKAPVDEELPKGAFRIRLFVIKDAEINYDSGEFKDYLVYAITGDDIARL
jgi:hypothetical protein